MPTESTFPSIPIPDVDLWTFMFERKPEERQYPDDRVIYIDPDTKRSYTYAQVRSVALDFGKGLKANWGWEKGDVLAFYTPNCIDTPAVTWGTHWAGGVLSPANPGYTAEELAFQLKDSGAKALITQKPFLSAAREACQKVGIPDDRIILMGDERDVTGRFKHFSSIRNISGVSRFRKVKLNPKKDLAFLVYSSGTTGHPKGVMLSHTNIVSNVLMGYQGEGGNLSWKGGKDNQGDRILAFLPFFHIYGLTCLVHQALYSGWTLVVMPKFDLERFCTHIQNYRITFAYVVPPVVLALGKSPVVSKYDLSSIRMLNSGAAPLTRDLVEAVWKRLKIPIKQGYGLSETSPTTHTQRWQDWQATIGSVGYLLPNQVAKYMSADETEVPAGQTGELWIKGPNIFLGYLNNPAGTANALTADGYFKTGDVGHQDKAGNFFITDRVKELIKYKGFQVPPAELEGLLLGHPDVDDAAVIGVYNAEQATEVPRAYVVPRKGIEGTKEKERDIMQWIEKKVASHKKLRGGVVFVDDVPKSASGKILRRVLKERVLEEQKKALKAKL
ncbi:Acetyl-CoA synthetase-like protein [Venustampulla echinocandica]|uniref:Acetyl-CoA synthetase-like protein n=1 Tax=Venustampulla echinocandica TaxID=2656787 RepID=A0A370TN38_9HELO|nr:Acetyl-CoA synthetase-like protein [Venustampulla echinocandica]RDL36925.1 Acetyl-CoA synthetase-like protein [Venustampulla echinocandica]